MSTMLMLVLIRQISRLYIWTGDERFFFVYDFIKNNIMLILFIVYGIEFLFIANYYWDKPLGYLQEVVEATEKVYKSQDEYIELSSELSEVEYKLNQLRLSVKENERIAKEAEQRKNDLLVYLAHDLKTPLTSVIGYLTLLKDEREVSKNLQEKYIGISLEKAERLELLINEFFEITRFNLTTLTLEASTVNLSRMLQQIAFEFEPMLVEKKLEISLDVGMDLEAKIDVDKMERVFDNLIKNAITYSFSNTIIKIKIEDFENVIQIKFINEGNPIPEGKLDQIFEQFYRLDEARGTTAGGSGVGLAVAKEIVELHDGTIEANSTIEKTEFKISLPKSL